MDERTRKVMVSRKSDEYETPLWLFNVLDGIFHFTLDPAASDLSHMCKNYYTMSDDGLSKDWTNETWYINPPYSKAKDWVSRAATEVLSGTSEGVMLLAARTETKYWHESVWPAAHYVLFLNGRLKFINRVVEGGDSPDAALFPSAVVIYSHRQLYATAIDTLSKHGELINLWVPRYL